MIYKKNLEKITICQNHKENNEITFYNFFIFYLIIYIYLMYI